MRFIAAAISLTKGSVRGTLALIMAPSGSKPSPLDNPDRLISLDALRGFDMFWILGGDVLVHEIAKQNHSTPVRVVAEQMDHCQWQGFAFYDLIFPLFLFIVGVSLVLSLRKAIAGGGTGGAAKRLAFRSISLYLLGIIFYGGVAKAWPAIRLLGVLQRIAICYLAAGLMFIYFRPRTLVIVAVSLLLLYWALLTLVPVPGVGRANFAERMNLTNYIDRAILPGYKWDGDHDPEGLLSTLPAIVTCLLGVFAGLLLQSGIAPWKKVGYLLVSGAIGVALGMAWGGMLTRVPQLDFLAKLQFPVIKKIWTSSFVLVAGGYSAALLGLFYLIIDVWKLRTGALPFVWIGMNAITLYMLVESHIIPFGKLADRLVGGDVAWSLGQYALITHAAVALLLVILLARFLFKRNIFLRI